MEPDSTLDLIIEDLPGIGRRYAMTGTNGGRIMVIITNCGRSIVDGLDPGADQRDHLGRAAAQEASSTKSDWPMTTMEPAPESSGSTPAVVLEQDGDLRADRPAGGPVGPCVDLA